MAKIQAVSDGANVEYPVLWTATGPKSGVFGPGSAGIWPPTAPDVKNPLFAKIECCGGRAPRLLVPLLVVAQKQKGGALLRCSLKKREAVTAAVVTAWLQRCKASSRTLPPLSWKGGARSDRWRVTNRRSAPGDKQARYSSRSLDGRSGE